MKELQDLEMDIAIEDVLLERQNETFRIITEIYQIREHNRKCLIPAIVFGFICITFFMLFLIEVEYEFPLAEQYGEWLPIVELIVCTLGCAGMCVFLSKYKWKKATELFKDKLVPAIIKEEFDEVIYIPDEGVSYEQASKMKVIYCGDRLHSEDYIEGDYKGYHFALSECCAEEIVGRDTYTAFFGKILDLDYSREAVVDVYVCGKNFSYPPNPVQAAKQTIKMESMNFNQHYTVYCGQREMAFYVLTPQVQEALLELGESMNYDMAVNFSGKRLYVAITDKHNTLELPNSHYINYGTERTRIKQDLGFVKTVLEILPLCPSTGVLRNSIDGYIDEDNGTPFDMFKVDTRIVVAVIPLAFIIIVFIVLVCML